MSNPPLTPTRKKQLEAYIACCRRVENSIIAAAHIAEGARYDPNSWQERSVRVRSIANRMRNGHKMSYAQPLLQLRIARSRFTSELSGLGYHG